MTRRRSLLGKLVARTADNPPVPFTATNAGVQRYRFGGGGPSQDNETYMRTYGASGTVFAIVSLLARSTAAAEWGLFRKQPSDGRVRYTTGDQGADQRIQVVQHAALDLWTRPNPWMTGHEFREAGQQHLDLTGEMFWLLARAEGFNVPLTMWPVRPDRLEPVPDPETFIKGWLYTSPDGEKIPLGVDEVIQTKYPNPMDPYRGLGPVQSVLTDVEAMKYGSEWNRNFFVNSATPGGIIQVDERLNDDEWNELTTRWRESHQGVTRAHRVAILEGGAKWVDRSYSMKDMQFTELRDVSRDVIREAFRIHKSMLGNADDVNRANAQTAEEVFGRWHIIERLNRFRTALNERLLPMFYPGIAASAVPVEFDYVNPLPDDRESDNAELTAKASAAQTLVAAGFDPDDVCDVVGLPRMKAAPKPAPAALPAAPADPGAGGASEPDPAEAEAAGSVGNQLAAIQVLNDVWQQYRPHGGINGHRHDEARV